MLACHDLRTPLATVHGFAHTLERSDDLDETTARYVGMISAAAGQLAELIDDLSVSARLAAGRYDPPLRAVFIELLQDKGPAAPAPDTSAVSRSGAKQLLDDDRVTAWDYTWSPGPQGLRYRPARETVIVWLATETVPELALV